MSLSQEIKEYALELGYSRVGITTADPFPLYDQALRERGDDYSWGTDSFIRLRRAIDPHDRLPDARSVIVAVYDYYQERFPENLVGKVGRLYQSRSYIEPPTRPGGVRVQRMRQFLMERGMQAGRWFMISSGVPDRLAAVRAGLVKFGRNTVVAAPGIGSFILIHTYIVDRELEYDAPATESHCPPNCRLCIEACPTQAIVDDFRINPRRCLTFNQILSLEGVGGLSPYISPEIRPRMGSWIHGCDLCQEACPRNRAKLKANWPESAILEEVAKHFTLEAILRMDAETEQKAVAPILHTYNQEKKYFQRNAAVALGNSGNREMVPHLAAALEDPEEIVRAHAAWSLGNLGGAEARRALEAGLSREGGVRAREEITMALAKT